jgi:NAD(P)-dependent dehydrogenase (short-subunit alcohol dehydrogenase family)
MNGTDTSSRIRSRFTEASTASEVLEGVDLTGKTAIVTGASSGVGVATAKALAKAGAEVTLAVRDVAGGEKAAAEIVKELGLAKLRVERIDLLRLTSVAAFARRWGKRPLDILINNAGLMAPPLTLTEDGFESQMAVNYFGHYLLTTMLAPNLVAAAPSRVVMVSAAAHSQSDIHLDDLNYSSRPYDRFVAYGHAKTAVNLFAVGFTRKFGAKGVTANAVTPGAVQSDLGRHVTIQDAIDQGWLKEDGSVTEGLMKTIDQGAATSVWVATAPELEGIGGLYFEDCQQARDWDPANPIKGVAAYSLDPASADKLWDITEEMVADALDQAA